MTRVPTSHVTHVPVPGKRVPLCCTSLPTRPFFYFLTIFQPGGIPQAQASQTTRRQKEQQARTMHTVHRYFLTRDSTFFLEKNSPPSLSSVTWRVWQRIFR
jgi:hypothetical protein